MKPDYNPAIFGVSSAIAAALILSQQLWIFVSVLIILAIASLFFLSSNPTLDWMSPQSMK
jgi:hypothetical protein